MTVPVEFDKEMKQFWLFPDFRDLDVWERDQPDRPWRRLGIALQCIPVRNYDKDNGTSPMRMLWVIYDDTQDRIFTQEVDERSDLFRAEPINSAQVSTEPDAIDQLCRSYFLFATTENGGEAHLHPVISKTTSFAGNRAKAFAAANLMVENASPRNTALVIEMQHAYGERYDEHVCSRIIYSRQGRG